jgi:hypothetical protein
MCYALLYVCFEKANFNAGPVNNIIWHVWEPFITNKEKCKKVPKFLFLKSVVALILTLQFCIQNGKNNKKYEKKMKIENKDNGKIEKLNLLTSHN